MGMFDQVARQVCRTTYDIFESPGMRLRIHGEYE
jgi:hypothetical protein